MAGLGVNLAKGVKTNGTSGTDIATSQPVVDATWTLMGSVAMPHFEIDVMWEAALEKNSFDRTKSNVASYNGTKWTPSATAAAGTSGSMYTANLQHLAALQSYAVFDENTKVSVNDIVGNNTISIFPNPARNVLNVNVNSNAAAVISNVAGQVVLQSAIGKGMNGLDIRDLKPGVYFLHIEGAELNGTARFVKQ